VFSAGNPHDYNFIKNFYNILRNFKYSTSNLWMSCLFYSVEMGIPHFIYGNAPVLVNKGDVNLQTGTYDLMSIPRIRMITEMFQGPLDAISSTQMEFVKNDLGMIKPTSRMRTSYLLYWALWRHMRNHPQDFKNLLYYSKLSIKNKFQRILKTS
jgi:hypothetical protein